jgi:hypothetical protein
MMQAQQPRERTMPDNGATITGNEEDGWNVEAVLDDYFVKFACEDEDAAEELRDLLNRCSYVEITK